MLFIHFRSVTTWSFPYSLQVPAFHKFFLTKPLADAFRKNVSGSKDGLPDWAQEIANGDDAGLFNADGAVWKVHGNLGTLVGGVRALLLQAARGSATEAEARALEARHHSFHTALLSACGSGWLMEFFQRLYVESERYRHPMLAPPPGEPARDVQAEHDALARAALTRNADLAAALLADHYRRTAQRVERLMPPAEGELQRQTAQARIDLAPLAP